MSLCERRRRIAGRGIILAIGLMICCLANSIRAADAIAPATTEATESVVPIDLSTAPTTVPTSQPEAVPAMQPTSQTTTQAAINGSAALADAQAKLQAGDLLEGRRILNDALIAGAFDTGQTDQAKKEIAAANQQIVFSSRHFDDDPYALLVTVAPGQTLGRIAMANADTWQFLAQINNLANPKLLRAGRTLKVIKGPFNAVVNKSAFTMDIWLGPPEKEGGMYITSYRVGLGQDDSTPTGTWLVEPSGKLRNPTYYSPRGQGIIEADDPKNPLGKYWIGLTGTEGQALGKMSYGIHGTIDPSSIGHMSSLGCIRLGDADISQVFNLLVDGKSMVIVRK